jgi:hypothetical protein
VSSHAQAAATLGVSERTTDHYSLMRSIPVRGNVSLTIAVIVSGDFYNLLGVLPPRSKVHGNITSVF